MTPCTRFEEEGLLQLERGESLDPHFDDCADCRKARAQYDRLKQALGQHNDHLQPAPDWQQQVLDQIDTQTPAQGAGSRGWVGVTALAASAVVAAVLFNVGGAPTATLSHQLFASDVVYRGVSAKPGDRLRLTSAVKRAERSELRLYRDDNTLVFACTDQPPCQRDDRGITADATLDAFGRYQAVVIVSDAAIPAATGRLDDDVLAAREAGSQVVMGETIDVR